MSHLVASLSISEVASTLRWSVGRVRRWLSHRGHAPGRGIPLGTVLTTDPELWASVVRRQQIEQMTDRAARSMIQTDYSVAEVASLYGWSRPRVYRWMRDRHVKTVEITANRRAIPLTSLMAADEDLWSSILLRLRLEQADA